MDDTNTSDFIEFGTRVECLRGRIGALTWLLDHLDSPSGQEIARMAFDQFAREVEDVDELVGEADKEFRRHRDDARRARIGMAHASSLIHALYRQLKKALVAGGASQEEAEETVAAIARNVGALTYGPQVTEELPDWIFDALEPEPAR